MNKRPIDLLTNANRYQIVKEKIEIPLDGEDKIIAFLHAPDVWTIQAEQEVTYQSELSKNIKRGLGGQVVVDSEWKKFSAETGEKIKPSTLAEFLARKVCIFMSLREILPRFLRDEKNNHLFDGDIEQQKFKALLSSNPDLLVAVIQGFNRLYAKINKTEKEVKN
jgi:hypothetical protein